MAISEPETRKQMTLEDGILQDFENMQREIEEYKLGIAQAEKAIEDEKQKTAAAEEKTAEAEKAIEDEKQKTAEAKEKTAEAEKEIESLRKRLAEFEKV